MKRDLSKGLQEMKETFTLLYGLDSKGQLLLNMLIQTAIMDGEIAQMQRESASDRAAIDEILAKN